MLAVIVRVRNACAIDARGEQSLTHAIMAT